MTLNQAMASLKAAGSDKTRKTYARHGVTREMFGVSYADLEKLRKAIKVDQKLAEGLWNSGNHDARALALMIADPSEASDELMNSWAADLDHSLLASGLSKLASKSAGAKSFFENWRSLENDRASSAAWFILAALAMNRSEWPDSYFEKQLKTIEKEIHRAPNETKYAMNSALIAIGGRNPNLQKPALAAAARIGKVEVDHGDTGCKTPDAAAYIKKMAARKKARA